MSGKTSRNGNKKKHHRTKKQFYKMKGCSNKQNGGYIKTGNLAYPSYNVPVIRNPHLAYTGGVNYRNAYPNESINRNLIDGKQYVSWLNSQTSNSHGGGNRSSNSNRDKYQNGGACGASCSAPLLQSGGNNGLPFGQGLPQMKGIPYAGGTSGAPLVQGNIATWGGVKPVDSNGNHYPLNTYKNGFTTNPINESPIILKGGKRRNNRNKSSKNKGKNIKGGGYNFSNSLMQDFVNLGRQFSHGLGSTYNTLNGFQKSPSPLPWRDQLYGTPSYNALKLLKL